MRAHISILEYRFSALGPQQCANNSCTRIPWCGERLMVEKLQKLIFVLGVSLANITGLSQPFEQQP
jgi:hypothetical protein